LAEVTVDAVVLRRRDSGESDRRLTLFTRQAGKLDVSAKGARKPASRLSAFSEALTVARFTFATGRQRRFVTQVEPLAGFRGLRSDFDRLQTALALIEVADAILPYEQPDEECFDLLLAALAHLERHPKVFVAYVWAQLRLLTLSGFLPLFMECAVTGAPLKEAQAWYSPEAGGYVSASHAVGFADRRQVAAEVLIGLAKTAELDAPPPNLRRCEEAQAVLLTTWRHVVAMPLPANEGVARSGHGS
jgi:DNA repair protein RecO (recombination protein O)